MAEVVTARLPPRLLHDIEYFSNLDQADRSTEVRKLLEIGVFERKKKELLTKYRSGEISTAGLSKELGLSIWEAIDLLKKERVEAQYDLDDFKRDLEALKL